LLSNIAKQLGLKNKLPLLILLTTLKRLIVLPAHRLVTLPTTNIPHDMSARRHVSLGGFAGGDVHDVVEEVGFAVLAAEIPTDDVFMVTQVSLAVLATVDFVTV